MYKIGKGNTMKIPRCLASPFNRGKGNSSSLISWNNFNCSSPFFVTIGKKNVSYTWNEKLENFPTNSER